MLGSSEGRPSEEDGLIHTEPTETRVRSRVGAGHQEVSGGPAAAVLGFAQDQESGQGV